VRQCGKEKLYWAPSKRGLFDIRSYYNVLIPHDSTPFPLRSIWQNKVPLKMTFFAWSAALGKILNIDNLRKRHVIVGEWCCISKKNWESVDHLLLHCEISIALWNTIFSSVGMDWVMPSQVTDLFACWRALGGRFQLDVVWKMIPPSSALWNTIFTSVEMAWVMPSQMVDLFACWRVLGSRFQLDVVRR
jgi:hypothetical protein